MIARFPFLEREEEKSREKRQSKNRQRNYQKRIFLSTYRIFWTFLVQLKGGGMLPFLGTDTVPAMLTPGEFVMSRGAVNMFSADTMMAMNKAGGGTNRPKYGLVNRI